jgi:hypothetical protein
VIPSRNLSEISAVVGKRAEFLCILLIQDRDRTYLATIGSRPIPQVSTHGCAFLHIDLASAHSLFSSFDPDQILAKVPFGIPQKEDL